MCFRIFLFHSHIIPDSLPQGLGCFTHMHTCTHSRTCLLTQIHMYVHALTQSHIHAFTHMVTHTYILTHSQTHSHAYTQNHSLRHTFTHIPTDALTLSCSYTTFTHVHSQDGYCLRQRHFFGTVSSALFCVLGLGLEGESGKELEKRPGQHVSIFVGL